MIALLQSFSVLLSAVAVLAMSIVIWRRATALEAALKRIEALGDQMAHLAAQLRRSTSAGDR